MRTAPRSSPFTLAGVSLGARRTLPLLPGVVLFASAFGAAAAQKGLDVWQTMAMSIFVFAGASQMVALEIWRDTWTPANIAGLVVVTATINARMILMGAAAQPFMSGMPRPAGVLNMFLFTDTNWLIGTRYHAEGGRDLGVTLGAGAALWTSWVASTLPGFLAGALVRDPRAIGLDLVMPVFFCVMLVPLWRGPRPAVPWAVAGVVALAVDLIFDNYAFIVVGALAGALTGAFMEERRR